VGEISVMNMEAAGSSETSVFSITLLVMTF